MKLIFIIVMAVIVTLLFKNKVIAKVPVVGEKAPSFMLPDANNKTYQLSDFAGQWLVLYFYPKDDTPGCTKEACHFRDDHQDFSAIGASVIGISADTRASHDAFTKKYNLPFPLLSDPSGQVTASYGALLDLMFIKFAKRYTFLIDPNGNIAKVYLSVDPSNHSQEIMRDLKQLSAQ